MGRSGDGKRNIFFGWPKNCMHHCIRVNLPNFSAFASLRVDFPFHFSSKFLKFEPLSKTGEHLKIIVEKV